MGYQKILIPLDGSEFAESALQQLPRLASPGATIRLVSVIPNRLSELIFTAPELWPADDTAETRSRQRYLDHIAESLRQQGYTVSTEVRLGPVVENIAESADTSCDLLLMASHHRHGLSKLLFGSVAEHLMNRTHRPVLIL